jgi:hypothetical protein
VVYVIEHLPGKCEALNSNPQYDQKKGEEGRGRDTRLLTDTGVQTSTTILFLIINCLQMRIHETFWY